MLNRITKSAIHTLSGNRRAHYQQVIEIAKGSDGKTVFEIGNGKMVNGKYSYSTQHLFTNAKEFIMTDINPEFGHEVLDITKMTTKSKYDIILCLNVLEHVYDFQLAINNLQNALKKGCQLVIAVPFAFPFHDESGDY